MHSAPLERPASRLLALLLALATLVGACSGSGDEAVEVVTDDVQTIALPDGFQPEGIALLSDTFFVGSIPTGAIYQGDLSTGQGEEVVEAHPDRAAIGLKVDGQGRLVVAGGPTGKAFIYDSNTGNDLATLSLASGESFVNDVVIVGQVAWLTDSTNPVLYRVDLPTERVPAAEAQITEVPLTGDLQYGAGVNTNGIVAAADGGALIVVQSNTGRLFTVDPADGNTREIDLGGERLTGGDGLLLEGLTLYVAQNRDNVVAEVSLTEDLRRGTVARRLSTDIFDSPTTIAATDTRLYLVNARFGTDPGPETSYRIVSILRP